MAENKYKDLRYIAYNKNRRWRKIRDLWIMEHPLCENCLAHGIIYDGSSPKNPLSVHHINGFIRDNQIDYDLLYNANGDNLQTRCAKCHGLLHHGIKGELTKEDLQHQIELEKAREEQNNKSIQILDGFNFDNIKKTHG